MIFDIKVYAWHRKCFISFLLFWLLSSRWTIFVCVCLCYLYWYPVLMRSMRFYQKFMLSNINDLGVYDLINYLFVFVVLIGCVCACLFCGFGHDQCDRKLYICLNLMHSKIANTYIWFVFTNDCRYITSTSCCSCPTTTTAISVIVEYSCSSCRTEHLCRCRRRCRCSRYHCHSSQRSVEFGRQRPTDWRHRQNQTRAIAIKHVAIATTGESSSILFDLISSMVSIVSLWIDWHHRFGQSFVSLMNTIWWFKNKNQGCDQQNVLLNVKLWVTRRPTNIHDMPVKNTHRASNTNNQNMHA